jgi:hypothetical protein
MKRIDEYIEGYFEGTLSKSEERRLERFLSSEDGMKPEYDEIRAVMGFYCVGRRMESVKSSSSAPGRQALPWGMFVAAACGAILLAVGLNLAGNRLEDTCVLYAGSQEITDKEVVMDHVESIISDLLADQTEIDGELNEFFGN